MLLEGICAVIRVTCAWKIIEAEVSSAVSDREGEGERFFCNRLKGGFCFCVGERKGFN